MPDIKGLTRVAVTELVTAMGERAFRAGQLFRWLHHRRARSFEEMSDLPAAWRARLAAETRLSTVTIAGVQQSTDGTRKYKLQTHDGKLVEAVYMPEIPDSRSSTAASQPARGSRKTLCISSQVGCAMGCTFCLTATMGLVRNMTPAEIVDQVHVVNNDLMALGVAGPRPLTNLVFMGMGEPLHNYEHLKVALAILQDPEGPDFSHRHITVSTSGLVPMIRRFATELDVKLAISLNATTDELRDQIMPVNQRWPLEELLAAVRDFPVKHGRRVTFEYVLLKGVNDSLADAERLAALVAGMPVKVNLIPYNTNPGLGFEDPGAERVEAFRAVLDRNRVTAVVRKNRGRDISAACGQLAVEGQGGKGKLRVVPHATPA